MITVQESTTESPSSTNEVSHDEIFQYATLRPQMNAFTLRPSWSGMTRATMRESDQMRRSCMMIANCNFQKAEVTSLVKKQYELMR